MRWIRLRTPSNFGVATQEISYSKHCLSRKGSRLRVLRPRQLSVGGYDPLLAHGVMGSSWATLDPVFPV